MDKTIAYVTRSGADAFIRLAAKVTEAEAIQWERAPRPKPDGDRTKAEGVYSDPTADTVCDERRLMVRDRVRAAYAQLALATAAAREATEALDAAIREWEGAE